MEGVHIFEEKNMLALSDPERVKKSILTARYIAADSRIPILELIFKSAATPNRAEQRKRK